MQLMTARSDRAPRTRRSGTFRGGHPRTARPAPQTTRQTTSAESSRQLLLLLPRSRLCFATGRRSPTPSTRSGPTVAAAAAPRRTRRRQKLWETKRPPPSGSGTFPGRRGWARPAGRGSFRRHPNYRRRCTPSPPFRRAIRGRDRARTSSSTTAGGVPTPDTAVMK
jgi:hypothetical protein